MPDGWPPPSIVTANFTQLEKVDNKFQSLLVEMQPLMTVTQCGKCHVNYA
jgi:hypothetical protein